MYKICKEIIYPNLNTVAASGRGRNWDHLQNLFSFFKDLK